jgi:hypothetical protein
MGPTIFLSFLFFLSCYLTSSHNSPRATRTCPQRAAPSLGPSASDRRPKPPSVGRPPSPPHPSPPAPTCAYPTFSGRSPVVASRAASSHIHTASSNSGRNRRRRRWPRRAAATVARTRFPQLKGARGAEIFSLPTASAQV